MDKRNPISTTLLLTAMLTLMILASCTGQKPPVSPARATAQAATPQTPEPDNILRIGMSGNYPPMTFIQGERYAGVEADFARRLPAELGRSVKISLFSWDRLIDALLARKIDVIMSGMTVTRPRQVRIDFTRPYLTTGLMAAFRLKDARKYSSIRKILRSNASIGVIRNTTGEKFVRANFPFASRVVLLTLPSEAAWSLKGRNIDLFVHDAPSIMWLVSENEADITGLWEPLSREELAWGVRKEDQALKRKLNAVIDKWAGDGTLDAVLDRWLPFRNHH